MKTVGTIQSRASQKLSSGFRINSAADDAAGLAISEKMRAQIRGLDMASKNSQDAISLIQTAEGGMQEIDNMVQRIRELVVYASNDTQDQTLVKVAQGDRQKIQDEINQLVKEVDETTKKTEFNKKVLLDGAWADPKETREISQRNLVNTNAAYTKAVKDLADTERTMFGDKARAIKDQREVDNVARGLDRYATIASREGDYTVTMTKMESVAAFSTALASAGLTTVAVSLGETLVSAGEVTNTAAQALGFSDASAMIGAFGLSVAAGATTLAASVATDAVGVGANLLTREQAASVILAQLDNIMNKAKADMAATTATGLQVPTERDWDAVKNGLFNILGGAGAGSDASEVFLGVATLASTALAGASADLAASVYGAIESIGKMVDVTDAWNRALVRLDTAQGNAGLRPVGAMTIDQMRTELTNMETSESLQAKRDRAFENAAAAATSLQGAFKDMEQAFNNANLPGGTASHPVPLSSGHQSTVDGFNKYLTNFTTFSLAGREINAGTVIDAAFMSAASIDPATAQGRSNLEAAEIMKKLASTSDGAYARALVESYSGDNDVLVALKNASLANGAYNTAKDGMEKANNELRDAGFAFRDNIQRRNELEAGISAAENKYYSDPNQTVNFPDGTKHTFSGKTDFQDRYASTVSDLGTALNALSNSGGTQGTLDAYNAAVDFLKNDPNADVTLLRVGNRSFNSMEALQSARDFALANNVDAENTSLRHQDNIRKLEIARQGFEMSIHSSDKKIADLNGSFAGLHFQVGANSHHSMTMSIGSFTSATLGIGNGRGESTINVLEDTGEYITGTLDRLDVALSYISTERSKIGAAMNRLDYTDENVKTASINLSNAKSRIADTDMAKEMMQLTKSNVLQQAAMSMLAQANQGPQQVLQLLQ